MRSTIDYGIDLGTASSAVAVFDGSDIQVIRNNANSECTPSAVWIDRNGRLFVGATAYKRLDIDPANAFAEFKLQMGTDTTYRFQQSGRTMRPEELSAEILKSLRADVQRVKNESIQAAVITVPAAFDLPQNKATNKAAELAGLSQAVLLQEPVAAAMAYGFQSKSDKTFWLVYDLRSGTFDVSLVSARNGLVQVVNHGGDNYLGGKLIDWEIVNQLLVPALLKGRRLSDFRRGNPKWNAAFAKLKHAAEEAKLASAHDSTALIEIELVCNDDGGDPVSFEYELSKGDVEWLMEPLIVRSVNICRRVLIEKRMEPGDIEKILLVGEPTQSPYLRQRLADDRGGLGIDLDFSIDPMTAIVRGAAMYATTQRMPEHLAQIRPEDENPLPIELDYKPVGSDPEPMVGGRVAVPPRGSLGGYTIEFVNQESLPAWRSGRIALGPDGSFVATLFAEPFRENVFLIELRDGEGTLRKTAADRLTHAFQPLVLTHAIGVALPENRMEVFFEKGTLPPVRKRIVLSTTFEFKAGEDGDLIRLPIVEGEDTRRADRNMLIGTLTVHGSKIRRDIPAGSEMEILIEVDASRRVTAKAFIPWIDEEFEEVFDNIKKKPELEVLREGAEAEKKRLEQVRQRATGLDDPVARGARIDGERMVHDVDAALAAAAVDTDAANECQKRILDLRRAIDQLEDALEWPVLVREAGWEMRDGGQIIHRLGSPKHVSSFEALVRRMHESIETGSFDELRHQLAELKFLPREMLLERARNQEAEATERRD